MGRHDARSLHVKVCERRAEGGVNREVGRPSMSF
jgi:hypothetical protein